MADKKISQLSAATTPLAGTEVLPIVQNGTTKQVSVDNLTAGKPVSCSNLTYTGTLTGSTGIANIGSGQIYKAADGTVGIGTTSASTINANNGSGTLVVGSGSGATGMTVFSGNAAGDASCITFAYATSGSGAYGAQIAYRPEWGRLRFFNNNTEGLALDASNNAIVPVGNLVIGTSGKGIDFSATAGTGTSELLADYEEGTWTPVVYGSGTAGTYTPSGVIAYYTKIGNQVTVWSNFGFSAASDGTGNVRIQGLPFSYKANTFINGTLFLVSVNTTTTSPLGLAIVNTASTASTVLYPALLIDNAGFEQIPISGVTTSSQIGFTVTYTVS